MSTQPLNDDPRSDTGSSDNDSSDAENPDTLVVPGSPGPLSPGRVTLHPDREAGVDELPAGEGSQPHGDEDAGLANLADTDLDNAEFDDQPNPR